MEDRVVALGEVAWDVLQRMVRELVARKAGGHLVEGRLRELPLELPLALRGEAAEPRRFAERLAAAIDAMLDDAVEHAAAFRPGHAFCHRCGTAACEHSLPPSHRHVAVGYEPTGVPRWQDFAQYCLDLRHPEVDRLYSDPPAFLTQVQGAGELRARLLDAFDTPSYELVGQLTAGFFPVQTRLEEGRGVVALTFQVAASRSRGGQVRLGLNILGRAPSGGELGALWERHRDLPWRRGVRWAQSALQSIRVRAAVARPAGDGDEARARIERRVEGILNGLARRLARDHRSRGRRTRHADERHESGARPTRKALEDARSAADAAVLFDERRGTLVVLGDRGRTHFFASDGRLVSSVRYSRDAIERKRKAGLWRDASAGEIEGLREVLEA